MAKKRPPIPQNQPRPSTTRPSRRPDTSEAPASNKGWLFYALAVLLVTGLSYLPSRNFEFVNWDDDPNITENRNIEMVGKQPWSTTIRNIFDLKEGNVIGNYNPLPILTFAVEKAWAGGQNDSKLIHTNNIILHLATTFFVMWLLRAMGIGLWGMALGGLFFGIHPMRVESVAWATERKDVLFALFFFAALVAYVRWLKQKEEGRFNLPLYAGILALALLSGFSKVQAVTLPLSMLALDYWFRRPLTWGLIVEKTPFWLISLGIGLANLQTLRDQGSTNDDITNFNLLDRLCIGAYSFVVYLVKLVFPYVMSPLYPYPKPLPATVYAAPLVFAAVCYGFWRLWKSDKRMAVFGIAFFFFNVMFLLQVLGAGQGFLADRFTYVPYFGFFAITAWYFERFVANARTSGIAYGVAGLFALIFLYMTTQQLKIWQNGETLWTHVMKYEKKTNSLPYWNRGQYFRKMGKYDVALADYSDAVNINPKNPELYNSRGKTYFDMAMSGKYANQEGSLLDKALADYDNAVNLGADKVKTKSEALINRGAAKGARGDFAAAIQDMNEGLQVDPDNKNGYFNRSIAYFSTQQYDKALADYKTYLRYDPVNANIWYEAGMLQRSMQRNQEAIADLSQAIALNPKMGIAYIERARAHAQAGNKAVAQQDYQQAQRLGAKLAEMDQRLMGGQ
jgi:protein O-mannosyl-transferase